jgi:hypothetical protein
VLTDGVVAGEDRAEVHTGYEHVSWLVMIDATTYHLRGGSHAAD